MLSHRGSLDLDLWPWCSACWDWGDGVCLAGNVVLGEALKHSCVTEAVDGLSHNLDSQGGADEGSSSNDREIELYNSLNHHACLHHSTRELKHDPIWKSHIVTCFTALLSNYELIECDY